MVSHFYADDKAGGVKFCTAVHRRPRHGISHFGELCSQKLPQKPKIGRIDKRANIGCSWYWWNMSERRSIYSLVLVFLCVYGYGFLRENKTSGVTFCMASAVHRRPRQGISHFGERCSPEAKNRTNRPAHEGRWMFPSWWLHDVPLSSLRCMWT